MKISKTELLDAVSKLDVASDADWTAEGLPSVERVQDLSLDETITREDLTMQANGYDRDVAKGAAEAKSEVDADDQTKLEAAKPIGEAISNAKEAMDKLADATGTSEQSAEERRANLTLALATATQDLADFDLALSRQRQMRDSMLALVDNAKKALEAEFPPLRHADIVKQWHESEAQKRLERSVTGAKSALDQKFVRPTGYGNRRPAVPAVETHA